MECMTKEKSFPLLTWYRQLHVSIYCFSKQRNLNILNAKIVKPLLVTLDQYGYLSG